MPDPIREKEVRPCNCKKAKCDSCGGSIDVAGLRNQINVLRTELKRDNDLYETNLANALDDRDVWLEKSMSQDKRIDTLLKVIKVLRGALKYNRDSFASKTMSEVREKALKETAEYEGKEPGK